MLSPIIKQTAKKITSGNCKGFFNILHLSKDTISFKNVNGLVFSFQCGDHVETALNIHKGLGLFQAGYVTEGYILGPTYESEYTSIGRIEVARFDKIHRQTTDNPDYIKRVALNLTFN